MSKDKKNHDKPQPEAEEAEVMDILDTEGAETEGDAEEMAESVDLQEQLEAARAEIEKEKKEYLFLMADFDNYRKRVTREKAEIIKNGGEKVLLGLLPIVDDFERGLAATANDTDGAAVREGIQLIYNKLIKYLESNGVKAMESTGAPFDADLHEAIAKIPAPSEDLKGKIVDTTQKGYMINDKVLRHAKVAVGE
ncbi:MAG: nucleotide exchange factor GrpE [Muribaculaceae bacterium]|nr:nucleotide exchange factor GrpE [Muribaculaceae bacterium]